MKQIYPHYYNDFKCIASECRDNCCIGWEIDIDEKTLEKYKSKSGEFGKRLDENISLSDTPHFILTERDRCPFLNDKNLCDIYINMGEESLCEICTQHPRFHEWFGEVKESGLGLCCEAAARLILSDEEPVRFCESEIDEEADEFEEKELFDALTAVRELMLDILQNRKFSVGVRLAAVLAVADSVQGLIDNENPIQNIFDFLSEVNAENTLSAAGDYLSHSKESGEEVFSEVLDFLLTLEPIDECWHEKLGEIKDNLREILKKRVELKKHDYRAYEYEHIAVYFMYRYMMKAVFDGDLLSRVKLAAVSAAVISLLNDAHIFKFGKLSKDDSADNAKSYSKEMEYCEENLERFLEESWESEWGTVEGICSMIWSI